MGCIRITCRHYRQMYYASKEHMGIFMTIILGIIGALIGGVVSTALGFGKVNGFNIYSIAIATVGSIIVLFVIHKIRACNQS